MDADGLQQRLSQISTAWSLLARAHQPLQGENAALAALVERYQASVYRYLLAATRNPDVADELFQEFALRLVRGDFGRVDAARGRFRDYVKSALINLTINHQKKKRPVALDASLGEPAAPQKAFDADVEFLDEWKKALLERTWEALAASQSADQPPFHFVLRFRTEHPDLSSSELTEHLNARLKPALPYSEAALRKILQRGRDRFADLLLEEVGRSLGTTSIDTIEQELIDLGLASHCRRALERRRSEKG